MTSAPGPFGPLVLGSLVTRIQSSNEMSPDPPLPTAHLAAAVVRMSDDDSFLVDAMAKAAASGVTGDEIEWGLLGSALAAQAETAARIVSRAAAMSSPEFSLLGLEYLAEHASSLRALTVASSPFAEALASSNRAYESLSGNRVALDYVSSLVGNQQGIMTARRLRQSDRLAAIVQRLTDGRGTNLLRRMVDSDPELSTALVPVWMEEGVPLAQQISRLKQSTTLVGQIVDSGLVERVGSKIAASGGPASADRDSVAALLAAIAATAVVLRAHIWSPPMAILLDVGAREIAAASKVGDLDSTPVNEETIELRSTSTSPIDLAALADGITTRSHFDAAAVGLVRTTSEPLRGLVRFHLQEGSWSHENGYEFGLEDEIEEDLSDLERWLMPQTAREPNALIVQGYVAQLSSYLLGLPQYRSPSSDETPAVAAEDLQSALTKFDGTSGDVDRAVSLVNQLAQAANWPSLESQQQESPEIQKLVSTAVREPALVAAGIMRWLPRDSAERASAALGGMTTAGGIGFFAQAVAASLGTTTATTGTVGLVGGGLGAVLGGVLGVLAARFVRE